MEIGLVQKINIDDEMQQAYLDYAMSVIVSRALPDARDGLKPVHRRILYAMYDMGLRAESSYKKSARIVGEVLGKYHPHGDMAVYDAMARMAQEFSMRVPLIDGQGNFGSIDGDPPAAMRYTEARLAPPALEVLADIGKNTVDFSVNFDDTLTEPVVLPAAVPNLLVNGATGIAVGMSTSIPPHNLGEVVDALKHLLANWSKMDDIGVEDLMQFIPGPDFPTGGIILQEAESESLSSSYGSGRGRITVRARVHLEEMDRGRKRVIVSELPYMTNKSSLIERIADLAREERILGIADLRDESDRQGMRIVIELSRSADPEKVLQDLYRLTPMQNTFSIILLALVEGEPRTLNLKQALRVYLDHRLEIVRRRSEHDLDKAQKRAHILEGYRVALKNLDAVIALIRRAPDAETARGRLMRRFKLSENQAQAILDLQLRRLAALERKKIEEEYKEIQATIKRLESLLRSPAKMRGVVSDELEAVKTAYGDRRRTQIITLEAGQPKKAVLTARDLVPEKDIWVAVSSDGIIYRTTEDKMPRQSGSAAPAWITRVNTRDTLVLAAENGEAAAMPLHTVPEGEAFEDGILWHTITPFSEHNQLAAVFNLPPKQERDPEWFLMTVSRLGMVKKSLLSELPGPTAGTFTLVKVNEGDYLGWVFPTDGQRDILLLTAQGTSIRFSENDVRPMGLVAAGVIGIKLSPDDELVGAASLPDEGEVFMASEDGRGKRVALKDIPRQGRYGQGVVAWKLPAKSRAIGLAIGRGTARVTFHLEKLAPKMIRLDAAPLQGRSARGKVVQELRSDDYIVQMTFPREDPRPVVVVDKPPARPSRKRRSSTGKKTSNRGSRGPGKTTRSSRTRKSKSG